MTYFKMTIFLVLFAFIFSGCSSKSYVYTPPTSKTGLKCIKPCQVAKNKCKDEEKKAKATEKKECVKQGKIDYKECEESKKSATLACEQKSEAEYVSCLKYADSRKSCKKAKCSSKKNRCKKASCYMKPDYEYCDVNYKECYESCGGTVDVVEKSYL